MECEYLNLDNSTDKAYSMAKTGSLRLPYYLVVLCCPLVRRYLKSISGVYFH